MNLQGKVALITGAKRIGAVVAATLAERGTNVALSYARSEVEARAAASAVEAAGVSAAVFKADLSSPDDCVALIDGVVSRFGRIDILVNMASVYTNKPLTDLTLADWDAVVNVDLRAAFLCAHAAIPHMRQQGGGRIINFSDWVAASSRPRYLGFVPYYVAKAGVKALSEALALELAADNILVNAIAPGPIVAPPGTSADEFKAVEDATPLARWGGEAEIAKTVLALLETDFITGETIRVDGGRHLR
jgi:NAD(P)-dependent dehydrogenase (short-subunit alcohol dehydrogenase family)